MKKLKKLLSTMLLVGVLVLSACSNDASLYDQIQEEGVLTVATSGTLIAASYYNDEDELTGFDVEVAREVGKRLGLDVKFEIMSVDGMLPAVETGRVDMAANDFTATRKRKENYTFSDPYKYSYSTMVVRKSDSSGVFALEDLVGKINGGGDTTVSSEIARHFGAEVKTYGNASNEAYLRDVSIGRTDVVVNDYFLIKFGVAAFPDFDIMMHPDLKFHPTEQSLVMKKDETELEEAVNKALAKMREDGTLTAIAETFYGEDASQKSDEDIEVIEGLDI